MEVQVFGIQNNSDVRKALRFFAERRVKTHFVDFRTRGPSRGELKRFADRLGIDAIIDRASRRFADLGLGPVRYSDERWLELLVDEPLLLRLPLTRWGGRLAVGAADGEWKQWLAEGK